MACNVETIVLPFGIKEYCSVNAALLLTRLPMIATRAATNPPITNANGINGRSRCFHSNFLSSSAMSITNKIPGSAMMDSFVSKAIAKKSADSPREIFCWRPVALRNFT
jgi:hypothetical protein